MKHLHQRNEERRKIAQWYKKELEGVEEIQMPSADLNSHSAHHIFPILSNSRNELKKHLKSMGIDTLIHYEKPIHFHESFSSLNHKKGDFPIAEEVCHKELSLPIYPGLTQEDVHYICEEIKKFFTEN